MHTSTRLGVVFVATAVVVATGASVALALDSHAGPAPQVGPDDPLTPPRSGPRAGDNTDTARTSTGGSGSSGGSEPSGGASITVVNHSSGGRRVLVDSAMLPEGGFVAIYDERNGTPEIVGVTPYLDAGEHSGTVRLGRVPGAAYNLTRLGTDATLVARLHRDTNANKRFDNLTTPGTDGAYLEPSSPGSDRPVEASARVTIPADRRPATPAVAIENQTSNGRTVEVASATLPDGGFVVLHRSNASGVSSGNTNSSSENGFLEIPDATSEFTNRSVLATTRYLPPGAYTDLRLAIGADTTRDGTTGPNRTTRLNRTTPLTAVVYNDTDASRRFEATEPGGDRPERADGKLVADTALVRIERPRAGTGTTTTAGPTVDTTPTRRTTTATTTARPPTTATPTTGAPSPRTTRTTHTATTHGTTPISPHPRIETTARTATTAGTHTIEPTHETTTSTPGATTTRTTQPSAGPGIIAESNTEGGPKNGVAGHTPYGGTDHERNREVILNDPLLSAFGVVVVVFAALAIFDWRRGGGDS